MNKLCCLILMLIAYMICEGQSSSCPGNLLINGSFTSIEGENVTAPGWVGTITPDINDENGPLNTTPSFVWAGIPLASPDGGTWQNFIEPEAVEQTVSLTAGQSYTFCFQYAAQGIINSLGGYVGPVGIKVYINNTLSFTTPDDTSQFTWETACYVFTPTVSSLNIRIMPTDEFYMGVDGACLLPTVSSSINENQNHSVIVYGNPVSNEFKISVNNHELSEIILYDSRTVKIMQQQFNGTVILNTGHLERGVYFYEIRNKNGVIKKGKVVKD